MIGAKNSIYNELQSRITWVSPYCFVQPFATLDMMQRHVAFVSCLNLCQAWDASRVLHVFAQATHCSTIKISNCSALVV